MKYLVRIIYNSSVKSFKIDSKTMSIYGTVDESGSDDVVYDHVVLAADVAAVQSMFTETIKTYIQDPAITKVLANVMNNNIGKKT